MESSTDKFISGLYRSRINDSIITKFVGDWIRLNRLPSFDENDYIKIPQHILDEIILDVSQWKQPLWKEVREIKEWPKCSNQKI